ncbi:AEC family transporter [Enterovirga sp.]|uniref:AEC family transporter n=1 Tax=Enterovirga sp. TaxID=2026350 RepID=UPI0026333581|nr:AEC family transporter [Enterovirga sp.]
MSDLLGLLTLLAPFFGLIGLGIASAKLAGLPAAGLVWMQFFLLYLALPALFFRLLSDKPISEIANWPFVGLTTLATAAAFVAAFAIGRAGSRRLPENVIGGVAGSYSNIGYMGPPLVMSFLGPAASAPVALIFVFDTLFLFTAVPALMSLGGIERQRPLAAALEVLRKVALHPFLIATAVGILASLARWQPPQALDQMITWLSGASAPCALFLLGVSVALRPVDRVAGTVAALVLVKLLLHPLAVWALLLAVGGFDPVWVQAAVIMAALPPALNIFVLAGQYRAGTDRASACVLVGTVASMATLTLVLWLFRTGALPPSVPGG